MCQDNLMASKVSYWPPPISYRSDHTVGQLAVFGKNSAKKGESWFYSFTYPWVTRGGSHL